MVSVAITEFNKSLYTLETSVNGTPIQVQRRYDDFDELCTSLREELPDLPEMPPKSFWRKTLSASFMAGRQKSLEKLVQAAASTSPTNERLQQFLGIQEAMTSASNAAAVERPPAEKVAAEKAPGDKHAHQAPTINTLPAMGQALRAPVIASISGSIRSGSLNTMLLTTANNMLESQGATVLAINLGEYDLPLFNQDLEPDAFPDGAKKLKEDLKKADGFLIACPEYNGFPTPLLINAITWATRGEGGMYDAFKGKIAVTISASPGPMGGSRATNPMRQLLQNCGVTVLPDTVAVGSAFKAFKEDGSMADEKQHKYLHAAVAQLLHHARVAANREITCEIMQEVLRMGPSGEYGSVSTPAAQL